MADSPVLFEEADGEPSGPRLRAAPFRSMGQGCSVRRLLCTVQGVFHRVVVREGIAGALVEEMASFACAAGLREGRWDGLRR